MLKEPKYKKNDNNKYKNKTASKLWYNTFDNIKKSWGIQNFLSLGTIHILLCLVFLFI